MSTKLSCDFGEITRPTTRIHAPPGGGSNWSLGGDTAPPAPTKSNMVHSPPKSKIQHSPVKSQVASKELNKEDELEMEVSKISLDESKDSSKRLRIAVIKTQTNVALMKKLTMNCVNAFKSSNVGMMKEFTILSEQDLPYAAHCLQKQGEFDGILLMGFLQSEKNVMFPALCSSLTQAIMNLSITSNIPIVQAVYAGTTAEAMDAVNAGWGKEYAENVLNLCQLGEFSTNVKSFDKTSFQTQLESLTVGNVLPKRVLDAPREVSHSLDELRESLKKHGARGIVGLSRKFRVMDDDGNRSLCMNEFRKAIAEHAMKLSENEIIDLFKYFDEDNSGSVSYDEFLIAIRGELNERRKKMVSMAFKIIDSNGNGIIELDDIIQKYNADQHPDVLAGRRTKNEIFREFLDTFDGGEKDGKVHLDEFIRYYANVSASIDEDDYFELVIRNAWHISGGEGWCENTTCRRVLVTHDDGTQSVEEIKNDIGMKKDDTEAMKQNLEQQGIHAKNIALTGSVEVKSEEKKVQSRPISRRRGAGESSIVFG